MNTHYIPAGSYVFTMTNKESKKVMGEIYCVGDDAGRIGRIATRLLNKQTDPDQCSAHTLIACDAFFNLMDHITALYKENPTGSYIMKFVSE